MKHGLSSLERLMLYVSHEPNSGCWLWTGICDIDGYGKINIRHRQRKAHRVAYEEVVGPIPIGLELDHLCRVRCCVNPKHLEPVTHLENMRRAVWPEKRGPNGWDIGSLWRSKENCPQGHSYSGDNLYISPPNKREPNGARHCRICMAAKVERFRERRENGSRNSLGAI